MRLGQNKNVHALKFLNLFSRIPGGIEPAFFRKPSSRQEGNKLHLECEIEALPPPQITWLRNDQVITEGPRYTFYRAVQPSNPNIHFVRLTLTDPAEADGGNYIVRAVNQMGEKDCTLALNFGKARGQSDQLLFRRS